MHCIPPQDEVVVGCGDAVHPPNSEHKQKQWVSRAMLVRQPKQKGRLHQTGLPLMLSWKMELVLLLLHATHFALQASS
jgi:hypothetical protein